MKEDGIDLTQRQRRFADEYLIDLNATAAYKRAGYSGQGHVAESSASEILSNPDVAKYITYRQKQLREKTGITQERVLAEYAKLAFLDPRRFYDENGNLIPVHLLSADVAAALSGMEISVSRSGSNAEGDPQYEDVKKIKFIDKKGALDSLSKTLGMFIDRKEVTGKDGGPITHKHTKDMTDDELAAIAAGSSAGTTD